MLHVVLLLLFKHILIEYADLLEVRKKYFEDRAVYSPFWNVNPEKMFDYLKETGMFYKVWGVLK